jgi:hypothetical protein
MPTPPPKSEFVIAVDAVVVSSSADPRSSITHRLSAIRETEFCGQRLSAIFGATVRRKAPNGQRRPRRLSLSHGTVGTKPRTGIHVSFQRLPGGGRSPRKPVCAKLWLEFPANRENNRPLGASTASKSKSDARRDYVLLAIEQPNVSWARFSEQGRNREITGNSMAQNRRANRRPFRPRFILVQASLPLSAGVVRLAHFASRGTAQVTKPSLAPGLEAGARPARAGLAVARSRSGATSRNDQREFNSRGRFTRDRYSRRATDRGARLGPRPRGVPWSSSFPRGPPQRAPRAGRRIEFAPANAFVVARAFAA